MRRIVELENVTVSMPVKQLYQMCLETLRREQEQFEKKFDDKNIKMVRTHVDFVCAIGALEELIAREK